MAKPSDFTKDKIKALWEAHKAGGGTQATLAAAAGVEQAQVSVWLRGERPSVDQVVALAAGFGVPAFALLPPDDSLLGSLVIALASFKEDELRRVTAYVNSLSEIRVQKDQDIAKRVNRD